MEMTDPGEVGFDPQRLQRLVESIQHDVDTGFYDGAQITVGRAGHLVVDEAIGFADRSQERALRTDDVLVPFSISKQLVVATVLSFVERGLLSLTQPVAEVLPDFGARGKGSVTLFHLLTHTGGVLADVPMLPVEDLISLERFTAYVCASAPETPPGQRVLYSKLGAHAVMASMLVAVDPGKRSFDAIVADEVLRPLGMDSTTLGPPPGDRYLAPVVARYRRPAGMFTIEGIEGSGHLITAPGSQMPGAGYTTTAEDFYKFADLLRGGGVRNGYRLLSPAMIELAARNHTGEMPNSLLDYALQMRNWLPWPAYHGLGFFVRGDALTPGPLPNLGSKGTFGGWGAGTSCFWVDPARDVCFTLITVGSLEDTDHLPRTQRLGDIVLAALTD
ncbi:MAG TPA: serine hydrolase domain-containing protein [Streptomyces sp.]|jgi:CubicO group peptidase (beta-lactamase class C family)|uniref:serine hydrolase domain-containing protein n=1 Tax=Streptomyces sp. TaxID=1931 RepID=UPI002BCB929A|nr:serine hydrolase domain-containing protein [Streptomyces sp.]HWU09785.1 serine hydrolase domain-containing protein [Streptomyces sp.]HYF47455.1 serine hydrolase domain-containing protein [Acidimicrobiales bacterium]